MGWRTQRTEGVPGVSSVVPGLLAERAGRFTVSETNPQSDTSSVEAHKTLLVTHKLREAPAREQGRAGSPRHGNGSPGDVVIRSDIDVFFGEAARYLAKPGPLMTEMRNVQTLVSAH